MNRFARLATFVRLARLAAPATVAAVALPFSACAVGNVSGEVDGDTVPAFRTGLVYEANEITDADDTVAVAAFYTFSNGCELVGEHMDAKADALRSFSDSDDSLEDIADDVRSFEEKNLPEDYWVAYVVVAAEDEGDIEDAHDVESDDAGEGSGALLCHHTGAVDAPNDDIQAALFPDFLAPFAADDNRDCFLAEEGEITVSKYDGKTITLTAEVELKDNEDDDAGEVEISAAADHCEDAESAVDGIIEEIQDFVSGSSGSSAPVGDNSCEFAFDDECDEPEGLNFCADGTDTADCT